MKKIMTCVISLVVAFACIMSLSACNINKLKAPTGISVDEDTWTLKWDAVENAESYVIDFEGQLIEVNDTQYDISKLVKQLRDYVISVKAVPAEGGKLKESDWSRLSLTVTTLPVIKPEVVPSTGLEYTLNADGTGYAVSVGKCRDKEVIIADTYQGLPVTEIADMAFYSEEGNTTITKVTIPESVKVIGLGAFANCQKLLRVVIKGDNLEEIGESAFLGDILLTNISFPSSLVSIGAGAFKSALLLKSVTFPDSLTSLGEQAYAGCTGLDTITFGKGLKDISNEAFSGCTALKTINWGHYVETIGAKAFTGTQIIKIAFPESIKSIGESAFINNNILKTLVFNEGLETIGAGAFANNINLKDIEFPSKLVSVGDSAFYNCAEIREVNLKYIETIGQSVFASCRRLKTVRVLDGAESVGVTMFAACPDLNNIEFASTVKDIGNGAFMNCTALKSVTFPDSLVRLGLKAFSGCSALETINISDTVKDIGFNCFEKTAWEDAVDNGYIYFDNYLYGYKGTLTKTVIDDIKPGTTGIGASAFASSKIVSIVIPEGVTSISENAFNGCQSLTSVTLPSTLDYIGSASFAGCVALPSITVPEGVETVMDSAFSNCTALAEVNLPASLKKIGNYVFEKCTALRNITLPSALTTIGIGAFKVSAITEIVIPEGVTKLEAEVFSGCASLVSVTLPSKLESIGINAFSECSSIVTLQIPETVVSFGDGAFSKCSKLTTINLPKALKEIPVQMFAGCVALGSIDIPSSVSKIGSYAFQGCKALKTVMLPDAVTVLAEGLFYQSGLTSFTIKSTVTTLEIGAFNSSALERIAIPATVKQFGLLMFANCQKLTSVEILAQLTELPKGTFYNCAALTDVVLPNSITVITGYDDQYGEQGMAFGKCVSLVTIKLPSSLKTIERNAFANCLKLQSIEIPQGVTELGMGIFVNCSALSTIVVPETIEKAGIGVLNNCKWYNDQPDGPIYAGNVLFGYKGTMPAAYVLKDIPSNITVIADQAIAQTNVTGIVIPGNIKYIGRFAFGACSSLKYAYIDKNVDTIPEAVFYMSTGVTIYTDAPKHDAKNLHNNWDLRAFNHIEVDKESQSEYYVNLNVFYDCVFAENYEYVASITRAGAKLNQDFDLNPPVRTGYSFGGWSLTEGAETPDFLYNQVNKIPNGKRAYSVWAK
ncbi:ig-like domain-containing surface protein [Firmicutes bacterium CAG:552]|nr:ig-like domain-containing surface protein [Firmicutes bacterium CAG:552]